MGKLEKIIDRFQKGSGTISYQELTFLLQKFNYRLQSLGKTSGSRVAFYNSELNDLIRLHRPHPGNELKDYQVKLIKAHLTQNKLI
jgi:hypothetical protein